MAQALLQRHTGHLGKKARFGLVSEYGHLGIQRLIGEALSRCLVGLLAQSQCPVVDIATTAKRTGKLLFLLVRRVKTIEIGAFDSAHTSLFSQKKGKPATSLPNQPERNACFLPTFENGGIRRRYFGEAVGRTSSRTWRSSA